MKHSVIIFALFLFFAIQSYAQVNLEVELRARLEHVLPEEKIRVNSDVLEYSNQIHRFYADQEFQPVWLSDGQLSSNSKEFIHVLNEVRYDGLDPQFYHQNLILSLVQSIQSGSEENLVDLELILTDAFFQVTKDLHQGKVDYEQFEKDWEIKPKVPRFNYSDLLLQAKNGTSFQSIFEKLYPDFNMYSHGREIIKNLYALDQKYLNSWKDISLRGAIRLGEENKILPDMRQRLAFWGYLSEENLTQDLLYDSTAMLAIKAFQKRNGMEPDGVVGKLTINALNQSPADLIDKAAINLERLRWLPDTVKTGPMVLVNIANYQLDFLNDRDTLLSERVIVGKRFHESPIFQGEMSYIVFSPFWNLPTSITKGEILPKARKDPGYLASKNIEIIDNSGQVVSPSSVDWNSKSFPYRLRQKPGEANSLGLVKFMFPNSHSVYIHDTPARSLFEREERAMSHGCIRVQNPADFAALLLRDKPEWTTQKIDEAMNQSTEKTVYLKEKIPVVLLYLTFWADGAGNGHFRPDVYERDEELLAALRK